MDEDQPWHPYYLGNPRLRLPADGVLRVGRRDARPRGREHRRRQAASWRRTRRCTPGSCARCSRQALKDYVLFPALTGPLFPLTLAGNATANLVRNVWAFNIIFCGHFPAGVETFSPRSADGADGRDPRPLVLPPAPRLGQHHRRPALPRAVRQPQPPDRAPPVPGPAGPALPGDRAEVREICERYGIAYNTGPLRKQLGSVAKKICRLALPDRQYVSQPRSRLPYAARWRPQSSGSSSRASQVASRSTGISKSGWASTNACSCSASHARVTSSSPRRSRAPRYRDR